MAGAAATIGAATGAGAATIGATIGAIGAWVPCLLIASISVLMAAVRDSILSSNIEAFFWVYGWLNYKSVLSERLHYLTQEIGRLPVSVSLAVKCFVIGRREPHGQKFGHLFSCHKYFLICCRKCSTLTYNVKHKLQK
jgi:hypothetical protein